MKICIDPGHGNPDPGVLGLHSREADIALAVALLLKERLLHSGIQVVMTREGPDRVMPVHYGSDLQARAAAANQSEAHYFLSIHCGSGTASMGGTASYCSTQGSEGSKFAKEVHQEVIAYTNRVNHGVKSAGFYVLRATKMPAALIELLYLSNPQEEQLLISPEWQAGAADALARGVCRML